MHYSSIDQTFSGVFGHLQLPEDTLSGYPLHKWSQRLYQHAGEEAVWKICGAEQIDYEREAGATAAARDALHPAALIAMCASGELSIFRPAWARFSHSACQYVQELLGRHDVGITLPEDGSLLSHIDLPHALTRLRRVGKAYASARGEVPDERWLNAIDVIRSWAEAGDRPFTHADRNQVDAADADDERDEGRVKKCLFELSQKTFELFEILESSVDRTLIKAIELLEKEVGLRIDTGEEEDKSFELQAEVFELRASWNEALEAGATIEECERAVQQQREHHIANDEVEEYLAICDDPIFWAGRRTH